MKRKLILRTFLLLLSFILLTVSVFTVSAEGKITVDYEKYGSITVLLRSDGEVLPGAQLALYKIASAYESNGDLRFKYTETMSEFDIPLEEVQSPEDISCLVDHLKKSGVAPDLTAVSDDSGYACFDGLTLGIYAVVQKNDINGYGRCSSFLVAIPTVEDDKVIYDVDASPKVEITKLVDVTVRKVWNDDVEEHDHNIQVQLLNNGKSVATATLNKENNWSFTWKDMPKSDSYKVKELNIPKDYYAKYTTEGEYAFVVTNSSTLIKTGQHKLPVPILAGIGIFLFVLGWSKCNAERKQEKEKE